MHAIDLDHKFIFVPDETNRSFRIYNDWVPNGNVVKQVKLIDLLFYYQVMNVIFVFDDEE